MSHPSKTGIQCVTRTFDEFEDATTIAHNKAIGCGTPSYDDGVHNVYQFQLRRVETKNATMLALACTIRAHTRFDAHRGNITFNCDQINTHVPYRETKTRIDAGHYIENGYYELAPETLEAICFCSELKIRIAGGNGYEEPYRVWCKNFQTYCRQFYNNVIDPAKFPESLSQPVRETGETGCLSAIIWIVFIAAMVFGLGAIAFFKLAS